MKKDSTPANAERRAIPASNLAVTILLVVLLAAVLGVVVGFGTMGVLGIADLLQEHIWEKFFFDASGPLHMVAPLILCLIGGVAIGLWTRKCGYTLDTMGEVIADYKRDGGYRVPNWGESLILFILPIAFGGAVGPEAGISGFAAAGLSGLSNSVRRAGRGALSKPKHPVTAAFTALLASSDDSTATADASATTGGSTANTASKDAKDPTDPTTSAQTSSSGGHESKISETYDIPHPRLLRTIVWAIAGLGFAGGCALVVRILGHFAAIARFDTLDFSSLSGTSIAVAVLALFVGWACAAMGDLFNAWSKKLMAHVGPDPLPRAIICGIALGAVACFMPGVLFSGQTGTEDMMHEWTSWAPIMLVLLVVLKLFLTKLCVAADWVGGEFFPTIFCGVCLGYALALWFSVDPILVVCVTTASLVSAWTRKPLLATAVLALCFPPLDLIIVLAAAYLVSALQTLTHKVTVRLTRKQTA